MIQNKYVVNSTFEGMILDLDNTLFDFRRSQNKALLHTLGIKSTDKNAEKILTLFHSINRKVWTEFEKGTLSSEQLKLKRSRLFLQELNLNDNPEAFSKAYLAYFASIPYLFSHAKATLSYLSNLIPLVLGTNGFSTTQRERIDRTDIKKYVKSIIISEEIGIQKPAALFFDYCIKALQVNRENILFVGDSPSADIRGAHNAGIHTCWINSDNINYPAEEPTPTYTITDIAELKQIILP